MAQPTWNNPTGADAPAPAPTIYGTSGVNSPDTYIGPGAAQGWTTPVVVGATEDAQAAIDQTVQAGGQVLVSAVTGAAQLLVPGKQPVTVPIKTPISTTMMIVGGGLAAVALYFVAKAMNKSGGYDSLPDDVPGIQMKGCNCGPSPRLAERYRPKRKKRQKHQDPAEWKVKTSRQHEDRIRKDDRESDRRDAYRAEKCRKVKKGKASFTVCGVK